MNWRNIQDPDPTEYREHISLGHWENTEGTERIEHQKALVDGGNWQECFYRYETGSPDSGRSYPTLEAAANGQ